MKSSVSLGMFALGVVLLIFSGVWASLFPGTSTWVPEKAARHSEIKDRLHNLGYIVDRAQRQPNLHRGSDPGPAIEEYKRLKEEFDKLNVDLQTAQDRPNTVAAILKWTGLSLAAVGIIGWYITKEAS
jgi:hypothetical protein